MDAAVSALSASNAAHSSATSAALRPPTPPPRPRARGAPEPLGEPSRLVEPCQPPEVVPVVRLVAPAQVLRAPSAREKAVGAAVVPDPPRAFEHVGPVHLRAERRRRSLHAVERPERPQRLAVGIPLLAVLLVLAADEAVGAGRSEPAAAGLEDAEVVPAEL